MEGDDRVPSARQCQQNVYNLSAMSRSRSESLFKKWKESLVFASIGRADGTVLTTIALSECAEQKKAIQVWVCPLGLCPFLIAAVFWPTVIQMAFPRFAGSSPCQQSLMDFGQVRQHRRVRRSHGTILK